MSPSYRPTDLSRRGFLRTAIGAAALTATGVPTLAACSSGGNSGSSGGRAGSVKLPAYAPFKGPRPDLPGTADGIPPGYLTYPKDLVTTVSEAPLKGGKITVLANIFTPLPPGRDKNAAWQAVESKLGGTVDLTMVPASDWSTKFQTLLAAGQLPDLMLLADPTLVDNLPAFLAAKCADLTPHLSGDAVKDYPNLANMPEAVWQGCVVGDKIYGLPIPRSLTAGAGFYNQKHFADAGVAYPTTAEEFLAAAKALTRPQQGRWAIVNHMSNGYFNAVQMMFGVPLQWRLEGGKLVRNYETPEYKAALEFMVQLTKAGVFVPGSEGFDGQARKNAFKAGKGALVSDGFSAYPDYWTAMRRLDAANEPMPFIPMGPVGRKAVTWYDNAVFAYTVVRKTDEARVKELLKVANFFAAPFGSTENLLLKFGVEGTDYTRDGKGNPVATTRGEAELTVPWRYITEAPVALYDASSPDFVQRSYESISKLLPMGVKNPTIGLISPTNDKKGNDLNQAVTDLRNDVIAGRKPISAFDDAVKKWARDGGDKIRGEYEQALGGASPR
jgi:putative aldouronate transport system substrate-binding protein